MVQRKVERVRARRVKKEEEEVTEAEEEEEGEMLACLHKLTIETAGTEEERALRLLWGYRHMRWRLKEMGGARERKGVEGLNGRWKTLSSSLRM